MCNNLMNETEFGQAALQKFGTVPPGFYIFSAEWLGDKPEDWKNMMVKGAQLNGKRRIPHTTMTTIVTREEINYFKFDAVRPLWACSPALLWLHGSQVGDQEAAGGVVGVE